MKKKPRIFPKKKFSNHIGDPLDLTNDEQQNLAKALEDKQFRDLLFNYAQEISDPKVRAENEKYLQQLEREANGPKNRKLMKPKPSFCLVYELEKTNKPFYVNVCSGDLVEDAFLGHIKERRRKAEETGEIGRDGCCGGKEGVHWQIPYVLGHTRVERYDGRQCQIVDIAFSEKTMLVATTDQTFKDLILQTVREAIDGQLGLKLKPGSSFYDEPSLGTPSAMSVNMEKKKQLNPFAPMKTTAAIVKEPKFELVESGSQDLANCFGNRKDVFVDRRPKKLIYRVYLPGVKKSSQVDLDIEDDDTLCVKVTDKYDLSTKIPYPVDDSRCSAQFIKSDSVLKVTLPVLPMKEDEIASIMAQFRNCKISEDKKSEELDEEENVEVAPQKAVVSRKIEELKPVIVKENDSILV